MPGDADPTYDPDLYKRCCRALFDAMAAAGSLNWEVTARYGSVRTIEVELVEMAPSGRQLLTVVPVEVASDPVLFGALVDQLVAQVQTSDLDLARQALDRAQMGGDVLEIGAAMRAVDRLTPAPTSWQVEAAEALADAHRQLRRDLLADAARATPHPRHVEEP